VNKDFQGNQHQVIMPTSDFGVLENVQTITEITPFKLKW